MRDQITMGGNPITLLGEEIKVGMKAPEFKATKPDMSEFNSEELKGKIRVYSVVPSIDTRICEFQTIRFNEEATKNPDVMVVTISVDLPFAQKRFCVANSIENSIVVSDHKNLDFGVKYGYAIEGLRLLARGIVVVDANDEVRYVEYVKEVGSHPDYDKVLEFIETM
ncbi:thiol peroxidase [Fusibacter bizertensis]|uniref:Thiol peroxidase n=1 Tax=Fusibacter bizertensis TaxID=1488331 RepID=A0ABT6NC32_9FIRM|nr:thiol peroxidase [Fusibacter bizertensis]MDH8677975.1 thiol peroxidase [Fusibacter bizertensis]